MKDFFSAEDVELRMKCGDGIGTVYTCLIPQPRYGEVAFISLLQANKLLRDRITVEQTLSGPKLYSLDSSYFEEPDTAEKVLADLIAWGEWDGIREGQQNKPTLNKIRDRAKKLMEKV